MDTQAPLTAIGAISGTSMDGIDVALVRTDGDALVQPGPGRTYPYAPALRAALQDFLRDPARAETDPLTVLEEQVSDAHADAVAAFLRDHAIDRAGIAVAGIHGQTIWHRPERRFTRQLGLGARIAARLGLPLVNRFRHADVASGGQGAPFAPLYHRALAAGLEPPVMVLNLGGVGNITYIDGDTVIAFDTGPASALIDDFVRQRRGQPYDADGALAAAGTADATLVARLMTHPYFAAPAPKSLDRNHFHAWAAAVAGLADADGAATLTAFTVASVAASLRLVPAAPRRWLVCGGGRHNADMMRRLRAELGVPVDPVEAAGWHGDFIEAECFAYLAVRSLRGLPLSLPTTTGVPHPMPGGERWTP
ncbi:MAG: anhydro-N-acetylmuramic acid kinase [Rhodospirillales bacterium 70-18]|nr:anhydro-N-acetylmuramic acid kinase [Rhodospirillales bacterium]OJY70169.1 MAG: anhydro-N-acetylmuramic acid kinase [Rhodospirillales bacterium 70-18]